MLRKYSGLMAAIHQIIDLVIVTVCFYAAYKTKINLPIQWQGLSPDYSYDFFLLLALISFHFHLRIFRAYESYRRLNLRQVLYRVLKAALTGTGGVIFLGYMMHIESISRLLAVIFGIYTFLGLCLFKLTLYITLARSRVNNYNTKNILIIGSRQRTIEFIKVVLRRKASGYRILGCLETEDQQHLVGTKVCESVEVIGTIKNFNTLLQNKTIDEVVFGIPLDTIDNVHDIIYNAEEMGKNVYILPDFQISKIKYYPQTAKANITDFLGVSTLVLSSLPKNTNELLLKSFIDFVGSIIGMVLFSPIFIPIYLAIKITSPGPVIFSQERIGLNGRRFKLHKFRTMVINAEDLKETLISENEMDGPVFKIKHDPRITPIGRFLRKTSLDELPQLSNVLKGEMSLVGPRPPLPSEVEKYKLWQRRRLSMKPGLTCIWQVSGRNNIPFEKWMSMDLEYIDNWSLALDLKLILLTVKEVTVGGGH